jgi:hypothetical protein
MNRILASVALAASLSACAVGGVLTGNTGDCASAEVQLKTAEGALTDAKAALSVAQGVGVGVALAQAAVDTISGDLTSIQALVTADCAVSTPAVRFAAVSPRITLAQAKALATRDRALADAIKP